MQAHDFLLEIGTEELPAALLQNLASSLASNIQQGLNKAELTFNNIQTFATPRRLAIFISQLQAEQPDRVIERRGPAVTAAYTADKQPTPALLGFARSCNIDIKKLETITTAQGSWLGYRYTEKGKSVTELMPDIINQAIDNLPLKKPMRWADMEKPFVRPVHWIVMLYDKKIIDSEILGVPASNITYGHRFLHPKAIKLKQAKDYADILKKTGFVIADFVERRTLILQQINAVAASIDGTAVVDENLLNEVTGIVEWPVALLVKFDADFLTLPQEVLMTAMQHHQKSFPIINKDKQLLPLFITISNLKSQDPDAVIQGNARVMRARLADAKFFYTTDCQTTLENRLNDLKNIVFQAKLGSLYDKSQRISQLANILAIQLKADTQQATRSALLAKTDLITNMVNEFPELQGIMGFYYAQHDHEPLPVATAIREHYLPRYAGDILPTSTLSCAVALADKFDTLVGIFALKQQPTGDKDPFGLRRIAVGILRIIIENQLNVSLKAILTEAQTAYRDKLTNIDKNLTDDILQFLLQRLKAWYAEEGFTANIFTAVAGKGLDAPFDFHQRIIAVKHFIKLPAAEALIAANKRVFNILEKSAVNTLSNQFDQELLSEPAEIKLAELINKTANQLAPLYQKNAYTDILVALASLQQPIDQFFDTVMVNVENEKIKNNRLNLLKALHKLFSEVAVISEL